MGKATRHSAILIGTYMTTSVLNYAFGVALTWFYKPAEYGVLGVAQSLLLLISLVVGSGFAWTVAHDIAEKGLDDQTLAGARAAVILNTALGLAFAIFLELAYITGLLPLGPEYHLVIPLVGVTTVILSARAVVNGSVRGLYKFSALGANLTGEVVVKIVVGLALVAAGYGVTGVLVGFASGAAASLLHSLWITRSTRWWKGRTWFNRHLLVSTAPLFMGMLGSALMLNLDVLGLKLFSPVAKGDTLAGLYQAAVILARTPVFIAQALTVVLFSYAAGDKAQKKVSYIDTSLRVWLRLLVPASLAMIVAPRTALSLFFPTVYQGAILPLQLASIGCLGLALVTLLIGVFQAEGERKLPAMAAGAATLVQILVLAWLVPTLGVVGASISLIAASAVSLLGLSPLLLRWFKSMTAEGLPPDLFLRLARVIVPLDVMAVLLLIMPDGSTRISMLIKFIIAGAAYLDVMLISFVPAWLAHGKWHEKPRPAFSAMAYFMQILMGG